VYVKREPVVRQIAREELESWIVHEDERLLVIAKPGDVVCHPSKAGPWSSLVGAARGYSGLPTMHLVFRLDRETSGIMVFAKTPEAKSILQTNWDKAEKRYQAVVEGLLPQDKGTFKSWLDETSPFKVFTVPRGSTTRHAVTHYRVLKRARGRTLVELTLETGRRHQIRVHLTDAGCPVLGDTKYGAKANPAKRLALHAWSLRFPHPVTNEPLYFESPLPPDLARLV